MTCSFVWMDWIWIIYRPTNQKSTVKHKQYALWTILLYRHKGVYISLGWMLISCNSFRKEMHGKIQHNYPLNFTNTYVNETARWTKAHLSGHLMSWHDLSWQNLIGLYKSWIKSWYFWKTRQKNRFNRYWKTDTCFLMLPDLLLVAILLGPETQSIPITWNAIFYPLN